MPDASDSSSISKRRALPIPPAHLTERMTIQALTAVLASLHFNRQRQTLIEATGKVQ